MDAIVEVVGLRKAYGGMLAVDAATFAVERGEVFGMVGPNGAGKTTIIECVEGLRRPDAGRVRVLGLDPWRERVRVRERTGVQLQTAALPDRIRVGEALTLFASFYRQDARSASARTAQAREALARVGLEDRWTAQASTLSGGQRQRLFIALALVNDPDVVFLDELTTGLDPQARRAAWDLVREMRDAGATVVLTTHFMEEAERLCDRVAIVDRGRIVALDGVGRIIASLGEERRVTFALEGWFDASALAGLEGVVRAEQVGDRVIVSVRGVGTAGRVTTALEEAGVAFDGLRVERPTLEDAFLALTGRPPVGATPRDPSAAPPDPSTPPAR